MLNSVRNSNHDEIRIVTIESRNVGQHPRKSRYIVSLMVAVLLAPLGALPAPESAKLPAKPNILFAIADDW